MPYGPLIPGAPWTGQGWPSTPGGNPPVSQARFKPVGLIPRAPDDADRRKASFSEKTSGLLNSLIQQGYLQLVAANPITWLILGGALVRSRPPGNLDDASIGANPGTIWIDDSAGQAYVCLDNSLGFPVWESIGAGTGYTGPTGLILQGQYTGGRLQTVQLQIYLTNYGTTFLRDDGTWGTFDNSQNILANQIFGG